MTRAAGRFISFEGGEGAGKSTQARLVAERLRATGLEIVLTREPGGTAGAEAIRALLLDASGEGWGAHAEAMLFAAARADHVARLIRPALARGAWVICDRFVDSTRAYQGAAGGINDNDICHLHRIGSGDLWPDRTLLLQISAEQAAARRADRGTSDRIEARDDSYHGRVVDGFAALAQAEPDRWRVIDAGGDVHMVQLAIDSALADLLP
jgi:dTMP kinase